MMKSGLEWPPLLSCVCHSYSPSLFTCGPESVLTIQSGNGVGKYENLKAEGNNERFCLLLSALLQLPHLSGLM